MYIKLFLLDGKQGKQGMQNTKPQEFYFRGNYAIEQCILKMVEIYFGNTIKIQVEDLLKLRMEDKE